MKRLIFVREVYQRIVRDSRLLQSNPALIDTKFARISIKLLRLATVNENQEERFSKMEELAGQVFDGLSDAIEELEKDVELNPKKFLGVALYPDKLWSWLSIFITLAFGMIQNKYANTDEWKVFEMYCNQ